MNKKNYESVIILSAIIAFFSSFCLHCRDAGPWTKTFVHKVSRLATEQKKSKQQTKKIKNKTKTTDYRWLVARGNDAQKVPLFSQLIVSWNVLRPDNGYFTFAARVRDARTKRWSKWYDMFVWGRCVQRSINVPGDTIASYKHVRLEVNSGHLADGFEVRVTPHGGASVRNLVMLYATVARLKDMKPETDLKKYKQLRSLTILDVPNISQMAMGCPFSCSPFSLCMVGAARTGAFLEPLRFAQGVYDDGLQVHGSWPFNVAHLYDLLQGKVLCHVRRLCDFNDLYRNYISQGIPVVVSVRGKIKDAPKAYPFGHLLVVKGFHAKTLRVVCNDPAVGTHDQVEQTYGLSDFLCAWEKSGRLGYIVEYSHELTKKQYAFA